MQERFDFGPEFVDHLPQLKTEIIEEEVAEIESVHPDQLRFFILDRFVEVK